MNDVIVFDNPVQVVEVERDAASLIIEAVQVIEIDTPPGVLLDVTAIADNVVEVITVGPQGAKGNVGEQGVVGATGPSPIYEQTFAVPSLEWIIHHDLNTHPVVTTVDTNGDEIIGDLSFPDNATVIVEFGMPVAGVARLKG